jgi:D-ribose pyranase
MIKSGLLNPAICSLIARVRHTTSLVIADRGFPFWPQIETVDISLVDNIPTVLDVLKAILPNFHAGNAWMAEEFKDSNPSDVQQEFAATLSPLQIQYEPHRELKRRVPQAIGLIRTGDTIQYANVILESA